MDFKRYKKIFNFFSKKIRKGETYQIKICTKYKNKSSIDPVDFFWKLMKTNSSPEAFMIRDKDYSIVSCSPETLIDRKGEQIITKPIAGTLRKNKNINKKTALRFFMNSDKEKKEHNYWTKPKVLESALNEESKLDWLINDSKAYHAARRLNCLDEATKHMIPLGSLHSRCIYSIEVKDKKIIYIGLTYNFKRRIRDHFKSERILTLIDRYGKDKIISKKLTEYLDNQEAIKKEGEFVNFYEGKNYEFHNNLCPYE